MTSCIQFSRIQLFVSLFMRIYKATELFTNKYGISVSYQDENITKIITEEAAAYFSGDRTLEDIARQIQSRVSLYVNENR